MKDDRTEEHRLWYARRVIGGTTTDRAVFRAIDHDHAMRAADKMWPIDWRQPLIAHVYVQRIEKLGDDYEVR